MMTRTARPFALIALFLAPAGLRSARAQSETASWISAFERRDPYTFVAVDPFDDRVLYAGTVTSGLFKSTDEGQTWRSSSRGLERPDATTVGARFWEISRIVPDARQKGVLYVGTPGGAFRSMDAAGSWQKLDVKLPRYSPVTSIAFDPFDDKVLYIGASPGVWKSGDSGQSWVASNGGLPANPYVSGLVTDPHRPRRLYAAVGSRVFRSDNAAETWEEKSTGIPLMTGQLLGLAIDPVRRDTLYVGTSSRGAFRTTDSGANWAMIEREHLSTFWTFAFDTSGIGLVYAAEGGHVLRSNDGVHWVAFGEAVEGGGLSTIAVAGHDPRHLFMSYGFSLFESKDGAASWRVIPAFGAAVETVRIHPADPRIVLVGTDRGGVLESTNGGTHWAILGLETETVTSLALSRRHVGLILAGTSNGLFRSSDGGKHWAPANRGLCTQLYCDSAVGAVSCPLLVTALAADEASNPTLYAAVYGGGLYRSTDLGASWQPTALRAWPYDWPSITAIEVDPGNPSHLVALTGDRGVLESPNRGEAWSPVESLFDDPKKPPRNSFSLAWGSQRTLFLAAHNRVLSRPIAEQSWIEVLESGPREVPEAGPGEEPLTERECYRMSLAADSFQPQLMASCDDSLSFSVDGGASWQLLPDLPPQAVNSGYSRSYDAGREVHAIAVRGKLLFVANGYGLFRSRNGGGFWEAVLPYRFFPLAPLSP